MFAKNKQDEFEKIGCFLFLCLRAFGGANNRKPKIAQSRINKGNVKNV